MQLPPISAQASAAPAPALEPLLAVGVQPIRKDLLEVGGWLLFFCIGLVILGPLLVVFEVFSAANSEPLGTILDLVRTAFGVVVGIFVWSTKRVAFTLLWIHFGVVIIYSLLEILGAISLANEGQGEPLAVMYPIRSVVYVVIWFFYFRKSQRVRATFGRNL